MVEILIDNNTRRRARRRVKKSGNFGPESILSGRGAIYGFIGEDIVNKYINGINKSSPNFDIIKSNKRIEVKTKTCSSAPKPTYECSVSLSSKKQVCDYFIFVRILKNLKKAWILGAKPRRSFFKLSVFYKEGQKDPNSRKIWRFKTDCYNLPINKLIPIEKFIKKFEKK